MATYAIGDVQGCHSELLALLDRIAFNPSTDTVWFTGDLVNRGPHSLETLRTVRSLGDAAISVLGNHDLHLLAVARGISRTKHKDTFGDVLNAPDRDELLDWLRHRPLLHHGEGFYMVHAGLPPQWNMHHASSLAQEAETVLQSDDYPWLLWHMYGNKPDLWDEELSGWNRLRFIINSFTRIRFCTPEGRVDFMQKGKPGNQPPGLVPWFEAPNRQSADARIVFGHWSTLGFQSSHGTLCLDTGCLWGGELTAVRLNREMQRYSVKNQQGHYQIPSLE